MPTATGRKTPVRLPEVSCVVCEAVFAPYRDHQVACSRNCREKVKHLSPRLAEHVVTCRGCGVTFTAIWSGFARSPSCEACTAQLTRERQGRKNKVRLVSSNPEANRARNEAQNLARYGITRADLDRMIVEQNGVCKICGDAPDPNGKGPYSRLHVDHHHGTGKVRALLCGRCNAALGHFKDDPERLFSAVAYLKEHTQ